MPVSGSNETADPGASASARRRILAARGLIREHAGQGVRLHRTEAALTRGGAVVLGLGLIIAAVLDQELSLSNQVLLKLPAPGQTGLRITFGLIRAIVLLWGLAHV